MTESYTCTVFSLCNPLSPVPVSGAEGHSFFLLLPDDIVIGNNERERKGLNFISFNDYVHRLDASPYLSVSPFVLPEAPGIQGDPGQF